MFGSTSLKAVAAGFRAGVGGCRGFGALATDAAGAGAIVRFPAFASADRRLLAASSALSAACGDSSVFIWVEHGLECHPQDGGESGKLVKTY